MTVIQFPHGLRPAGIVYTPVARGEILRAVFGGTVKAAILAIRAGVALIVAIAFVLSIILGVLR